MRQFSLLGMIGRLGAQNILHRHGLLVLETPEAYPNSWFLQVRDLSAQYALPDPLDLLENPKSKASLKTLVRSRVIDWWNQKLRKDVVKLDSLVLFRAEFMSLSHPHPIWTTAGSSSYEVRKATVQARMLSGRYRTCWLRRHWSGDPTGVCKVPGCSGDVPGTLVHIVTGECPGLASAYIRAVAIWSSFLKEAPLLFPLIRDVSLGQGLKSIGNAGTLVPGRELSARKVRSCTKVVFSFST